jgi:hypothetical protein
MKEMICSECGYVGEMKKETPGSFIVELGLWLCFILPGLIYSLWRIAGRHVACSKCGGHPIPIDSPMGKKLLNETKGK